MHADCFACRQDLLQKAVQLAREAGANVALDLASFEVVREFKADIEALIQSKQIDCCFCNEATPPAHPLLCSDAHHLSVVSNTTKTSCL